MAKIKLKIRQSAFQLVETGEFIKSRFVRDYCHRVTPSGKEYFVDGGPSLSGRRYGGDAEVVDFSLNDSTDIEECINKLLWEAEQKTTQNKLVFVLLKDTDTVRLKAIRKSPNLPLDYDLVINEILKRRDIQ